MTSSADSAVSADILDGTSGDDADPMIRLEQERQARYVRAEARLAALLDGVERWYSVAELVLFFSRTTQWYYEREGLGKFRYRDGTLIKPVMAGGKRRFNLYLAQQIAVSSYRDGNFKWDELRVIFDRMAKSEEISGTPPDPRDEEE